jgi:hypothetical protein
LNITLVLQAGRQGRDPRFSDSETADKLHYRAVVRINADELVYDDEQEQAMMSMCTH